MPRISFEWGDPVLYLDVRLEDTSRVDHPPRLEVHLKWVSSRGGGLTFAGFWGSNSRRGRFLLKNFLFDLEISIISKKMEVDPPILIHQLDVLVPPDSQ